MTPFTAFVIALIGCGVSIGEDAPDGSAQPHANSGQPSHRAAPAKNAVLIVLDTTRADLLERAATPHLDSIASAGFSASRAWSSGTWTVPSVVSLFTGLSVRAHGYDLSTGQLGRYPPLPARPMLAEVLQENGFTTWGIHANPYLSESLGFDRGFSTWRRSVDKRIPAEFEEHVKQAWTDGGRHFAYLHFIGPHSPVRPSDASAARHDVSRDLVPEGKGMNIGVAKRGTVAGARSAYRAAYTAVLEDTDARIGAVLAALGSHRESTMLVVTSDHGELLGEHGRFGHGTHVWEALSHVPLIVDHPTAGHATEDLSPSVNNLIVPALITSGVGVDGPWTPLPTSGLPLVVQREGHFAMSTDGRIKAVWSPDNSLTSGQVFDLQSDPSEEQPIGKTDAVWVDARAAFELQSPAGVLPTQRVQLSDETVQQLGALGYVP